MGNVYWLYISSQISVSIAMNPVDRIIIWSGAVDLIVYLEYTLAVYCGVPKTEAA